MAFKSLLLHLDGEPQESPSCRLGLLLGRKLEAHVTGLILAIHPTIPTYAHHPMLIDTLVEMQQADMELAEALAEKFRKELQNAGVEGECRIETCFQPDCPDIVGLHGRYCDLIIMDRPNPDKPSAGGLHLADQVVLTSGRPTLIAPDGFSMDDCGKRIVVAWNATREAGRAVNDAIPFLESADAVRLVVVDATSSADGHGEEFGADIALHLARHGCKVDVQSIHSGDRNTGEALLGAADDFAADLIVMGAYGHSRLREIVLGGVTQTVLEKTPLPVLMSH